MPKSKSTVDPKVLKLDKLLKSSLSKTHYQLLSIMPMEVRKDKFIFRVPIGMFEVEAAWIEVKKICRSNDVKVNRANVHATVAELREILSNVEWLWKNWIAYGMVTLLIAEPGLGKSAIALDLIKRVVSGNSLPLTTKTQRASNTIWVEAENAQQILMMRVDSMQIPEDRVFLPIFDGGLLNSPNLDDDEHKEVLRDLIDDKSPRLLVIDSLGGAKEGGENKVEEVKPFMEFITSLARDSEKLAIILVHHFNKGDGSDATVALSRVRGSSVIAANCRSIIALEQGRPDEIKMSLIKSNIAPRQDPLAVTMELNGDEHIVGVEYAKFIETPKKLTKTQQCADWLVAYLETANEPVRMRDLIDVAEPEGYSRGNLYAAKGQLGQVLAITGTGNTAYLELAVDSRSISMLQKAIENKDK